ncbi:hypothetical protein [Haloferax mucosum]|uniref:hypothetical protein n=1 Tax=Haloferax mucosum TaxID=403181 RepID=UPI0023A98E31|nr:hypothetical protein [Haloferax mucosum]
MELKSPLLSRFDLIFTIRSEEDEEKMREIPGTMVSSRQRAARRAAGDEVEDDDSGPFSPVGPRRVHRLRHGREGYPAGRSR